MTNLQDLFDAPPNKCFTITNEEKRKQPKSAKHIANVSASKCKTIMTPAGVFPSQAAAIQALNTYKGKFNDLMKKYPDQYYYIKDAK